MSDKNEQEVSHAIPDPPDMVLSAMNEALAGATGADPRQVTDEIVQALNRFLGGLINIKPLSPSSDESCTDPKPDIALFCAKMKLDMATAANTFQGSQATAAGTLQTALAAWSLAKINYEFEVTNADLTLRAAVATAIEAFKSKFNNDSRSRDMFLHFTMESQVAQALQSFATTMASAGGVLASAAGSLLSAYVTFITTVAAVQTQRQQEESTAQMTFWESVEQTRDVT